MLPNVEENLARGRADVDTLEEDFAIRARALLSPVVPLARVEPKHLSQPSA